MSQQPTGAIRGLWWGFLSALVDFGRFWEFSAQVVGGVFASLGTRRLYRLLVPQSYEIGCRTVPVILVTGSFVGMVLAVQSVDQFKSVGVEDHLGVVINVSVVRELGPVLAAVMLAGRIGGALTAELGTMNVTEQIDALRSMGADPIRYLVVPRFLACMLLAPILTAYCDLMGAWGGEFIAVGINHVHSGPYWEYTATALDLYDLNTGFLKALVFGAAIGLISCYKGFHCRPGAEGVGRACTEAFVTSFIAILMLDFFLAVLMQSIYTLQYGFKALFQGRSRVREPTGHVLDTRQRPGIRSGEAAAARPGQDNAAIIELKRVSKRFGAVEVLCELNLAMGAGQTTVIIGESGTGKSVLLKHLVGLLRPDAGEVHFHGRRIDTLRESHLVEVRRRFGFLFQGGALFDSLTVAENVAFPLVEHRRMSREEMENVVAVKLRLVGLDGLQGRKPAELSGGQKKRVALARAIALEPEVVLYDEPTTGLDPVRSDIINELIRKLQRELRVTSIVVTHDMTSAYKVGDRIVLLRRGQVIADGPPELFRTSQDPEIRRFVDGRATQEDLAALNE